MRRLLSIKTVFPRPGLRVWYDDQRAKSISRFLAATRRWTLPSWAPIRMRRLRGRLVLSHCTNYPSGMILFMNPSNSGTVKAVSPWAGL